MHMYRTHIEYLLQLWWKHVDFQNGELQRPVMNDQGEGLVIVVAIPCNTFTYTHVCSAVYWC